MIIDPLAAIIEYLDKDNDLTLLISDRIASRHKFGSGGWTRNASALTLRLVPGAPPELNVEMQVLQFELRCWASSALNAMKIYRRLVSITRDAQRKTVTTADGNALIQYMNLVSGPSLLYDLELEIDYVLTFVEASVAETAVA